MKKIAVYYDSLLSKGGAERVVIELANHLEADIITSGYNPELTKWIPIKGKVIDLGNFGIKFFKPFGILFEAPLRYFFSNVHKNYDINIYCGFISLYGAKNGSINIWRCFTPNRIMYDLQKDKLKDRNILKSLAFVLHILFFKNLDQKIVKNNFKTIIVQSVNVENRVKKYYGIQPKLIYDYVHTNKYLSKEVGDYYLTVSRLFPEKRVSIIVDAFLEMPDKKLIIVGDGPEKGNILKKIGDLKNIKILSDVSEKELLSLYASCLATIYIPKNEDFGLIPLESMASGKPCIAANEGGCKETIINGKTGILFNVSKDNLIDIIKNFNVKKATSMKNECLKQAKKFDISKAFVQWNNALKILL